MIKLADYEGRLEEIPFDFHEMIGALAPRRVFINAPLGDSNFRWESVDRIAAAALPVFRLYGKPENLRVEHPDCDHDFPESMRPVGVSYIGKLPGGKEGGGGGGGRGEGGGGGGVWAGGRRSVDGVMGDCGRVLGGMDFG